MGLFTDFYTKKASRFGLKIIQHEPTGPECQQLGAALLRP